MNSWQDLTLQLEVFFKIHKLFVMRNMILKIVIGQTEMEIRIKISVVLDQNTLWIVGGYNGSSLANLQWILSAKSQLIEFC